MAEYKTGDVNPSNPNYVMGSSGKWVRKDTLGSGGLNEGQATVNTASQPPTGATYISNESQLAGLTESQIWRDPNSDRIYRLPSGQLNSMIPPEEENVDITRRSSSRISSDDTPLATDDFTRRTLNSGLSVVEQAAQELLRAEERRIAKEESMAQKLYENVTSRLEDVQNTSLVDFRRDLMQEFEIEQTRKQLAEYKNQLIALDEQYQEADSAIRNQGGHAAIIRGARALKQEEYARKAATIQAKVAVVGEQYDLARETVEGLYEAQVLDLQRMQDYYERLQTLAKNDIIRLDQKESDTIDKQMNLVLNAEQRARENKEKFSQIFADPILAKAFQQSGATLDMDFTEAMKQMLPYTIAENTRLENLRRSGSGGGGGIPSGIRTKFATEQEENLYNFAYNTVFEEQAGPITPDEWKAKIESVAKQSGMSYEQAEGQVINFMQEIQNALDLTGRPTYDEPDISSDLGGRGAFGFPEGTSAGEVIGRSILETPSTFNRFNRGILSGVGKASSFYGDLLGGITGGSLRNLK